MNFLRNQVVISDDPLYVSSSVNSLLEVKADNDNKGVLLPAITTAQRLAILPDPLHDKGKYRRRISNNTLACRVEPGAVRPEYDPPGKTSPAGYLFYERQYRFLLRNY